MLSRALIRIGIGLCVGDLGTEVDKFLQRVKDALTNRGQCPTGCITAYTSCCLMGTLSLLGDDQGPWARTAFVSYDADTRITYPVDSSAIY